VYLADQKLAIAVPRVRDRAAVWPRGHQGGAVGPDRRACRRPEGGARGGERRARIERELGGPPLRALKARALRAPALTIADGHLGIWSGLAQIYPTSAEQRCWNHNLRNVLDVVPRTRQLEVNAKLQAIANADSQASCERQRAEFRRAYPACWPNAVERLERDWARMVTYYAFPAAHWRHLRTTNVIESPFHAVRLRTTAAKRFKRVENATAFIWKLLLVVQEQFRKLNARICVATSFAGIRYRDGALVVPSPTRERHAA